MSSEVNNSKLSKPFAHSCASACVKIDCLQYSSGRGSCLYRHSFFTRKWQTCNSASYLKAANFSDRLFEVPRAGECGRPRTVCPRPWSYSRVERAEYRISKHRDCL